MPNCFDIEKQSKTHIISYETMVCCTYFIKLCVNLCQFHNLNSGIGVEFQGTHRSLRISVIDSFQYNGIKTLIMSKRHQYFYGVMLRLLHTF